MKDNYQAEYVIRIDPALVKKYPHLSKIPQSIASNRLDHFITAIESRAEKMKAEISNGVLWIEERTTEPPKRLDYLGLVKPDAKLQEICQSINEDTGIDPRREAIYSRRGSAFENLSENAMINQTNGLPGRARVRHALDPIASEEIVQRREIADARWTRSKRHRFKKGN
jgi:hypothetical protein